MDKSLLLDLQQTTKALKTAIIRAQNGIAGLQNLSKLGETITAVSTPNIFNELRQLEADMQKCLKSYRDQLHNAFISLPTDAPEEHEQ